MSKESSMIPCLYDPSKNCNCPLLAVNAGFINNLGNKIGGIRGSIQREGYDRVSPGLIKELLENPEGGFYTEALNQVLPFSSDMLRIRQNIIDFWKGKIIRISGDHGDIIPCPYFKKV
jgi:hypothetical protein